MNPNRLPRTWLLDEVREHEAELDALWKPPVARYANSKVWSLPVWFRWGLAACWSMTLILKVVTPAEMGPTLASSPRVVFEGQGPTVLEWHMNYARNENALADGLALEDDLGSRGKSQTILQPRSALERPKRMNLNTQDSSYSIV